MNCGATPPGYEQFFPRAPAYGSPERPRDHWAEGRTRWRDFSYSERHLQSVWFDAALRPAALVTHEGESVVVEDPGVWNLESGPDFLGAALRLGPAQRRMAGDVEVHIHPSAWRSHGHGTDPRYQQVRVHVTYFNAPFDPADFPPGVIQIALRDALSATPDFSFDHVDLTAYPFARRAPVTPCRTAWRSWPPGHKLAVLDAAGQERLRRKAVRLQLLIEECGLEQAVYEETAVALGFKQNKAPFRQLARLLPLARLREWSQGEPVAAFALLCGVAGLLPSTAGPAWSDTDQRFFRQVWDHWWRHRDHLAPLVMPRATWSLGGQRPANHPLRRLMALAALFAPAAGGGSEWIALAQRHPTDFVARFTPSLQQLSAPYFDRRSTFGGRPTARRLALLGPDRVRALLLNLVVPLLATAGQGEVFARGLLDQLPPEADNALLRQTALDLFGPDHPPSFYRTGLRRQGLLQIFHDYCLADRSRCAECGFPDLLRRHAGG